MVARKLSFVYLIAMLFISIGSLAQYPVRLDFKSIDTASLKYYNEGKWNRVVSIGNTAISNGYDYYYLRMRMGYSYLNMDQTHRAVKQFNKALNFNRKDYNASKVLFDIYSSYGMDAKANSMIPAIKYKDNVKLKPVSRVYLGAGYFLTNNFNRNSGYSIAGINDTLIGSKDLIGDKINVFLGTSINFSPNVTMYVGASYLSLKKRSIFQFKDAIPVLDSVIYFIDGFNKYYSIDYNFRKEEYNEITTQIELYSNLNILLDNDWSLSLYGNFINVDLINFRAVNQNVDLYDTSFYQVGEEPEYYYYSYDLHSVVRSDSSFFNYLIGAKLIKDLHSWNISFGYSYSNMNGLNQNQTSLEAFYYLGRYTNSYANTRVIWIHQPNSYPKNDNRFIFYQDIGFNVDGPLWANIFTTLGNINNGSLESGLIIYNQADDMKYSFGLDLTYKIKSKFELKFIYSFTGYKGYFIEDEEITPDPEEWYSYNYQFQNFIGQLVWRF